mmetsp:Transcript_13466/g.27255  ORF Transcript_13466/g.27255 Transcript_13466/m.27255 type:complete len:208 (-) Transcript_13466:210-833(-)
MTFGPSRRMFFTVRSTHFGPVPRAGAPAPAPGGLGPPWLFLLFFWSFFFWSFASLFFVVFAFVFAFAFVSFIVSFFFGVASVFVCPLGPPPVLPPPLPPGCCCCLSRGGGGWGVAALVTPSELPLGGGFFAEGEEGGACGPGPGPTPAPPASRRGASSRDAAAAAAAWAGPGLLASARSSSVSCWKTFGEIWPPWLSRTARISISSR